MTKLGQYFTTDNKLKEMVFQFIQNKPDVILEPSIGQGDLVLYVSNKTPTVRFHLYEIDTKIKLLNGISKENIIYGDFLQQNIAHKYKTIIGNPPFVKTAKSKNLYIDFTEKCYNLLEDNGELIFIVPADFFKLTSASNLLNIMMDNGSFTNIYHPHNERLFENASIDVLIYRYCRNKELQKIVIYNDRELFIVNSKGLITFEEKENINSVLFNELFDIYVGIVSGKEDVYKNEKLGNIEVLNSYNKIDKYIYIEEYPSNNKDINEYLLEYRDTLIKRKIKKFNNKNWFEWGALRNITKVDESFGKECIYIYNLTRQPIVAFIGKVMYFGGSLIMLKPKRNIDLDKIVLYINSIEFKNKFMYSGRFKIGHRQISNSYIPNNLL